MAKSRTFYFNGIDAVTGERLVKPLTAKQLSQYIVGEPDKNLTLYLQRIWGLTATPHLGFDADLTDLNQAGWGVIFHEKESNKVKAAIEPLIKHRRRQISDPKLVKVMEYRDGEEVKNWLGRYGLAYGSKDPAKIPYYLLIIGSPERIPFLFGHLLDIEYAVGRLDFDRPQDYGSYAAAVVDYETCKAVPNAREAVFFGTRHKLDPATEMSADMLVSPLANGLPASGPQLPLSGIAQQCNFNCRKYLEAEATKAALADILAPGANEPAPAFIFTASHGMGWPNGDENQLAKQGALLCQDWPGFGKVNNSHYFAASDLPAEAKLNGLITFHFACFGAGTPKYDRYIHDPKTPPPQIASQAFIAALPKAMLAHKNGGILASIGHVERAWGYSIATRQAGAQIDPFRKTIGRILFGQPVGYAIKDFNEKYAALSANLAAIIETKSYGGAVSDEELAVNWVERNDSEGYLILGDPAVHLRV